MRRLAILATVAVVLASCGSAPGAAPVAPAAAPATAVGAVALKDIDLEPFLIQPGDLPSGMEAAQVKNTAPAGMKDYPAATNAIDQRFQRNGKTAGGVVVLLYEQQADLDKATAQALAPNKYSEPTTDVGEKGKLFLGTDLLPLRSVTFVRCHAIVDVTMSDVDTTEIAAYAKRLDKRLQAAVCQ